MASRSAIWGGIGGAVAGLAVTTLLGTYSAPIIAIGAGVMGTVGSASAIATVRAAQTGLRGKSRQQLGVDSEREAASVYASGT